MATGVFISWSGDLSKQLAQALRDWIPSVLQYVEPYFTPDDIEKGAKWDSDIANELENSQVGLICLTRDNTEKPWILFEAGALSKNVERARVCTILFGIEPTDLKGPLTRFQATHFNKADFKKLIGTINNAAGESKLKPNVLDDVFAMWWPKLEDAIKKILSADGKDSPEERRDDRDLIEEILAIVRKGVHHSGSTSILTDLEAKLLDHYYMLQKIREGGNETDIQVLMHNLRDLIGGIASITGTSIPDLRRHREGYLNQLLRDAQELSNKIAQKDASDSDNSRDDTAQNT